MTERPTTRLRRAVRAMREEGLPIQRAEISPDGRIVIVTAQREAQDEPVTALDRFRAARHARRN